MALYPNYFYNKIISKYISIFGSLLNDIKIKQKISESSYKEIVVPISFSQKKSYIVRLNADPQVAKQIAISLPRIGYEITGYMVDTERKLNRINSFIVEDDGVYNKHLSPIPYNFLFDVVIMVQNKDEGFQIIEQILPFFNPDIVVSAKNIIPGLSSLDIPIVLNSVNEEDIYETDFFTLRNIIWTLNFTLKGYIFSPKYDSNLIKKITIDFCEDSGVSNNIPYETITILPGLSNTGIGTSNISETINYTLINPSDNYSYITQFTEGIEI